MSLSPIGASLNAGDDPAVPGDVIDKRGAAQYHEHPPRGLFHRSCFDVQLVMTRRAFIALERPVGMVDRMLGHPFSNADLALDHAALKGDVALVAVGDDFFDTISGACRQNMTDNPHKRHEPHTFLSPAVDTSKIDASRSRWSGLRLRRRLVVVSAPHL